MLLLLRVIGLKLLILPVNSVLLVNLLKYKWEIIALKLFLFLVIH
jgi:hypothetical protein